MSRQRRLCGEFDEGGPTTLFDLHSACSKFPSGVDNSPPLTDESSDRCACCIAGGGPAGVMLGFLLARAGVKVAVLETHADFFRDFRGDTIHPSTLELMFELGLLDQFLQLPHNKVDRMTA